MGLWSTIKGWLNIGGVKVKLEGCPDTLSKSNPTMSGKVQLQTKSDKTILGLEVKVIEEFTTTEGSGDSKRSVTKTSVLGSVKFPGNQAGIGFPLELKNGDSKEQTFTFSFALNDRLQNWGGVMGGLGKAMSFMGGDKLEYYLVAEASVKGAAFATSDRKKLKVGA